VFISRKSKAHLRATAGLIAASLMIAACGADDGSASDRTAGNAPPHESADAGSDTNPDDPYCNIERAIDAEFQAALAKLNEDAPEAELQAAARAVVASGLLEAAGHTAPEAIRTELELLIANVRAAASGNVAVFFTPESDAAGVRVDAYCELTE
jgi:hypothetical protein